MAARTAHHEDATQLRPAVGRYERAWTVAVVLTSVAWIVVAVRWSAWLPLAALVAMLSTYGGLLAVRQSVRTAEGRRQYLGGVALVAAGVLVLVGIAHHPAIGLASAALLGGASPHALRWVAAGGHHEGS